MPRSALPAPCESVSVAELFPELGSLVPPGAVTVAVFTRSPLAAGFSVTTMVYVAVPPTGRSTVSLTLPATGPAVQVAPPAATQVQLALATCGSVVTGSATVAPITALGPAFDATTVYVTVAPGV